MTADKSALGCTKAASPLPPPLDPEAFFAVAISSLSRDVWPRFCAESALRVKHSFALPLCMNHRSASSANLELSIHQGVTLPPQLMRRVV